MEKMNMSKACRLCLTTSKAYFETSQLINRDILDNLCIKINLDISEDPITCNKCTEDLRICFDFKSLCVHTGNKITNFLKLNNINKTDMKQVYLNEVNNFDNDIKNICRFCMKPSKNFCILDKTNEDENFADMLETFLPEVSLNVTNNPIGCTDCLNFLNIYFDFKKNCQETEQYVEIYHNSESIITKAKVDFNNIAESFLKLKSECVYKIENTVFDIKEEIEDEIEYCKEGLLGTNSSEFSDVKIFIKDETDVRDDEILLPNQNELYEGNISEDYYTITKCVPSIKGVPKSQEASEYLHHNIFDLKAAIKKKFKRHVKFNKKTKQLTIYKCAHCSYETKKKSTIDQHVIYKHKDASELQMYKCVDCIYEAKTKSSLNRHIIYKHKNSSEIKMYKCGSCPYEAKMKDDFKKHIINKHKDPNEARIFKCADCSYAAKRKDKLNQHIIYKHTDYNELQMYKCDYCTYEAKTKGAFKRHFINKHKDPSELHMYKCTRCSYEAKGKDKLNQHIIYKHTDLSELQMHKCAICPYEAKTRGNYRQHIINKHMHPSELQMYKCAHCSFESKTKDKLIRHIMYIHTDSSELHMFKCANCSFETKRKDTLSRHIMYKHMNSGGTKIYKCNTCSFETKRKDNLNRHMNVHKDSTQLQI